MLRTFINKIVKISIYASILILLVGCKDDIKVYAGENVFQRIWPADYLRHMIA